MFQHSIPAERRVSADNTACRSCSTHDRDWSTVGKTSNATGDEKTQIMCVLACQPCSKRGWSQVTYEATPSNPVPPTSGMVVAFSPNHWLLTDSLGSGPIIKHVSGAPQLGRTQRSGALRRHECARQRKDPRHRIFFLNPCRCWRDDAVVPHHHWREGELPRHGSSGTGFDACTRCLDVSHL